METDQSIKSDAGIDDLPLGKRERNRREKWQRIADAARQSFATRGYDETTLRAIAKEADVGFGTIFGYVEDKRDLLFALFAADYECIGLKPWSDVNPDAAVVDQLTELFEPHYRLFAGNPALAREFLREVAFDVFHERNRQRLPGREWIIESVAKIYQRAAANGSVNAAADLELAAEAAYMMFSGAVRQWLRAPSPDYAAGVARLRSILALQIVGLAPGPREAEVCAAVLHRDQ